MVVLSSETDSAVVKSRIMVMPVKRRSSRSSVNLMAVFLSRSLERARLGVQTQLPFKIQCSELPVQLSPLSQSPSHIHRFESHVMANSNAPQEEEGGGQIKKELLSIIKYHILNYLI